MTPVLKLISYAGLAVTVVAPVLVWMGALATQTYYNLLAAGMVAWFATAVFWIKRETTNG